MENQIETVATTIAEATDSDILLYSGDIERPYDDKLLDICLERKRRKNVMLLLCSRGGNPDAAYRMARGLQDYYEKFTVLLAGRCKSAGTLIAIGAHELVMSDHAELGPLDIQLGKKDELFETASGLTVLSALTELENKAFELFENAFLRIKIRSDGSVTFKTATLIATELAKGVVAPIMAQVDPMHVGEVSRAMKIGQEYGRRLSDLSKNLGSDALSALVDEYPSHGFVIDRKEAAKLFVNVRNTTEDEGLLVSLLRSVMRTPKTDGPILFFMSKTKTEVSNDSDNASGVSEGTNTAGARDGADQEAVRDEDPPRPGVISELFAHEKTGT
ncbi:SDH family Clp fold serine proteinase [Granulicella rosea]|uniref:SDH family Clp fold serine proteinase n=1 Tax=Granulicella rosea TaxID=474952 RepID=UPI0015957DD5|nr:SppA protein [Granulicella rosea]